MSVSNFFHWAQKKMGRYACWKRGWHEWVTDDGATFCVMCGISR
jgi:hypothetical protein